MLHSYFGQRLIFCPYVLPYLILLPARANLGLDGSADIVRDLLYISYAVRIQLPRPGYSGIPVFAPWENKASLPRQMLSLHQAENTYSDKQKAMHRRSMHGTTYTLTVVRTGAAQRLLAYAIHHLGRFAWAAGRLGEGP